MGEKDSLNLRIDNLKNALDFLKLDKRNTLGDIEFSLERCHTLHPDYRIDHDSSYYKYLTEITYRNIENKYNGSTSIKQLIRKLSKEMTFIVNGYIIVEKAIVETWIETELKHLPEYLNLLKSDIDASLENIHEFFYDTGDLKTETVKKVDYYTDLFFHNNGQKIEVDFFERPNQNPEKFEDLFYNSTMAEMSLSILKEISHPFVDKNNNYIGSCKGVFPLWIKSLKENEQQILKHFDNKTYIRILNKKISGLNLGEKGSEFSKHYKSLVNNGVDKDIKRILNSKLSKFSNKKE